MSLRFDEVERAIKAGVSRGIRDGAEVLAAASDRKVPTKSGRLKGTRRVTSSGATAAVSYDTEYAVDVHEDLADQHDDGEAKFLERAGAEERQRIAVAVADGIRRALR